MLKKFGRNILIICALGVVGVCLYLLTKPNRLIELIRIGQSSNQKTFGHVTRTENKVSRRHSGHLLWLEIESGDDVHLYDRVYTADESRVNIQSDNGLIQVHPNTLLIVKTFKELPLLQIDQGQIEISVPERKKILIRQNNKTVPIIGTNQKGPISIKPKLAPLGFKKTVEDIPLGHHSLLEDMFLKTPENNQVYWLNEDKTISFDLQLPPGKTSQLSIVKNSNNYTVYKKQFKQSQRWSLKFKKEDNYTVIINTQNGPFQQTNFSVYLSQPPQVVYPIDESVFADPPKSVSLIWQEVPLSQSYKVEVAEEPSFKTSLVSEVVENAFFNFPLRKTSGDYYWRVKVQEGSVPEKNWSQPQKFTLGEPSEKLIDIATAPIKDEMVRKPSSIQKKKLPALPPVFDKRAYKYSNLARDPQSVDQFTFEIPLSWKAIPGVQNYKVEWIDSKTKKVIKNFTLQDHKMILKGVARMGDKHLLRVYSKDPSSGKWLHNPKHNPTLQFSSQLKLADPNLSLPKDNSLVFSMSKGQSQKVILNWAKVKHAQSYNLQVASDASFNNIVYSKEFNKTATPVELKSPSTQFFWRVKATHPKGQSDWSKTYSFKIKK